MASKHKQGGHGACGGCENCEAESFSRNNYFTGKLMVERDFTDEQRYFREKIRLHHQRLHGSGVVCGLQVIAHDEPCDDRYVILQPGSAVDCCGQDILVTEPEVIDLYAFPQMQEMLAAIEDEAEGDPDAGSAGLLHRLQLCIKYRECPGEEIPVLYDECGCDDTQCAPNRILESYGIELLIDPEPDVSVPNQPALDWGGTVNIAHAEQVYLHEASNRLYVMTGDDDGILYQVSTDNYSIEASFALGRRGLALTTNESGDELYVLVAHDGGIAAGDGELWVFDVSATNLAAGTVRDTLIANSDNSAASLKRLADGRVLALFHAGGRLRLWDAGLTAPMSPVNSLDHGIDLFGLSAGADPQFVFSAEPDGANVHRFAVDAADFAPTTINAAVDATVERVSRVAAVISSAADQLLVLDAVNNQTRLIDPSGTGTVTGTVPLAQRPVDVAISNGAHWAYVLVADGEESFVQSINLHTLMQGSPVTAGTPIPLGDHSQGIVISAAADRLFAPYIDDMTVDNAGGVAVIDIDEANCRDLLWPEDCPSCDSADCLVLATIENYRPGARVLDMPSPAPDADADLANSIARINNLLGRKRLPSTQAIVAALECLMDNCCGGSGGGEQGPPGSPGTPGTPGTPGADGDDGEDGRSITQVEVEMVPCGQPPSGSVTEIGANELLLSLEIPGNCNPDLAHLCNISWFHDGIYQRQELTEFIVSEDEQSYLRFLLRFDAPVHADDLNTNTIRLSFTEYLSAVYQTFGLHPVIRPGVFSGAECELEGFSRDGRIDAHYANGAEILVPIQWIANIKTGFVLRFSVHGDFIRDQKDRAADLDHLPLWLTSQDPAQATAMHTGDGVPGGEFVSWFTYSREPIDLSNGRDLGGITRDSIVPPLSYVEDTFFRTYNDNFALNTERAMALLAGGRIAINRADVDELMQLSGVGPELARAIVEARRAGPIRNERSLLKVPGMGKSLIKKLRDHISFEDGE